MINLSKVENEAGIYFLLNKKNEIIYVGLSKNIKKRVKVHNAIHSSFVSLMKQIKTTTISDEKERMMTAAFKIPYIDCYLNKAKQIVCIYINYELAKDLEPKLIRDISPLYNLVIGTPDSNEYKNKWLPSNPFRKSHPVTRLPEYEYYSYNIWVGKKDLIKYSLVPPYWDTWKPIPKSKKREEICFPQHYINFYELLNHPE